MAIDFKSLFPVPKPVIGMLHLAALPGSPGFGGSLEAVRSRLLNDLQALLRGGVHGLMIENYGDVPFYPACVPSHVVAAITALACDVRKESTLPLGINVLRNDGRSALGIAAAVGAQYVRVNVLTGARVTDQGLVCGIAHELLRDRTSLNSPVAILADIDVKHSAPLAPRDLADEVSDTLERGLADALIVSGSGTGKKTNPDHVRAVRAVSGRAPVLIGSGTDPESIPEYLPFCDGFIVGTWIKTNGVVDADKVKRVVEAAGFR